MIRHFRLWLCRTFGHSYAILFVRYGRFIDRYHGCARCGEPATYFGDRDADMAAWKGRMKSRDPFEWTAALAEIAEREGERTGSY